MLCANSINHGIVEELFKETNSITLPSDATIVQAERTSQGPAVLVEIESRYFFYLKVSDSEIIKREVDADDVFAMARIAEWSVATTKLSNRKQRMRVPTQCVMRAVGTRADDIDLFLDNEGKAGLSAKLRQMEWYKNAHPEIKTAILKLLAHLGLFEQPKIELRMETVDRVAACFTLLEIHNLFGGLAPGIRLSNILKDLDAVNAVDGDLRKRFDPNGQKAIQFFLQNMYQEDFKPVACYTLTHYVPEVSAYNLQKKTSVATFESAAALSSNPKVSSVANSLNAEHDRIADMLHERSKGGDVDGDRIARRQDKIEGLRIILRERVLKSGDPDLIKLLRRTEGTEHQFSVEFIKDRLNEEVCFPSDVLPEMVVSAKNAGYRSSDGPEVQKLCEIYRAASGQPEKLFDLFVTDQANDVYRYVWLKPDDPDLYTLSMLCGGTCMRPNFAGEAALWGTALSEDVAVCAILNHNDEVVAYFRVNYDKENQGFYIDTVESRFSYVLNNEDVWRVVKRAASDMALSMEDNGVPVVAVTFREERGNRLKIQWDRLPVSSIAFNGKAYRHPSAPWPYGDDKPRVQKEVWKREGTCALQDGEYRKISVKHRPVMSRGATGTVYALDDQRIVKVFPAGYPMSKIVDEFKKASLFHSRNLPSPRCYGIVQVDNRFGLVFERVYGISLTKAVLQKPHKMEFYIKRMVQLSKRIHAADVAGFGLDSAKHQYLEYLSECEDYYREDDYDALRKLIMSVPDRWTLLHGDFHSENIMVNSDDELIVIDFAGVGYGHPIFDLMAEGAVMPVTLENDPQIVEGYLGANTEWIRRFWDFYIGSYLGKFHDATTEADTILMSRLRNAITAAITDGIPEEYLRLCAENTHHLLIPEIDRLMKSDWSIWE